MVTKSSMLKLLEQSDIPINKGRTNILKKGQKHSRSMVLGKVRQLYSSCDGKVCKVPGTSSYFNFHGWWWVKIDYETALDLIDMSIILNLI